MLRIHSSLRAQQRQLARAALRSVSTTRSPSAYERHPGNLTCKQGKEEEKKDDYVLMHPVYTEDELQVQVTHRAPETVTDKLAYGAMRALRVGFDFFTGYGGKMNEAQYLRRILFLETVAGVPGMVGAMVRSCPARVAAQVCDARASRRDS